MEILNVLAAAVAAWMFGAIWYMSISKGWMDATGVTEDQVNNGSKLPYLVSLIGAILVAGMLRHVLAGAGITEIGKSITTGVGLGLFVVCPWIVNNILYGMRDRRLIWMDGLFPVVGMGIMGLVLALF